LLIAAIKKCGYISAPYTIESEDWMYNYVYEYFLTRDQMDSADFIANKYIEKTLWSFEHYEQLALRLYNEPMKHIFLCHDNLLHAHFLPLLMPTIISSRILLY
jgi:hypothetical protein